MLIFAFCLSTSALFIQSILFPHFTFLAYAPWIALVILQSPSPKCFYLCFLAGAMLDLMSDDPMGTHALNYTVIATFLYRYRSYFLYDHPIHLSLFTLIVSFCSTPLQLFLLFLFDRRVPFTGQWALGDLFLMPIADALYALLWFALPLILYKKGIIHWRKLSANNLRRKMVIRAKNLKIDRT